ncbi:hypothetical protein [Oceanobacillus salinisoli]|uniref:hypothetical protein n=1 Tax=Oceanobacillus salinisoli TaxID=2678611 RepID=UPI0012E2A0C8|nr:hypothetical protein [Oceanobacillus salinisoli]
MIKIIIAVLSLIGFPIVLTILMDFPIFNFASGQVDSWITFWGSYVGAIIGASVVYFVARLQINKQYEQQIRGIKLENEHSTKREMRQFLITNKLGKYEQLIEVCNQLADLNIEISNQFVRYVTFTDIVNNKESPEKEKELKDNIYELKSKHMEYYSILVLKIMRLITLLNYVPDLKQEGIDLQQLFTELWDEAKSCYLSKEKYKEYLNPDEKFLLSNSEIINKKLAQ